MQSEAVISKTSNALRLGSVIAGKFVLTGRDECGFDRSEFARCGDEGAKFVCTDADKRLCRRPPRAIKLMLYDAF